MNILHGFEFRTCIQSDRQCSSRSVASNDGVAEIKVREEGIVPIGHTLYEKAN